VAQKVQTVSDIDGADDADYGVVVRGFPGVEAAKLLDVTKDQAETLQGLAVKDTVTLEVRNPDTTVLTIQVPIAAFKKWIGDDKVVANAAHLKGRRPGYSPSNGS